MEGIRPRKICYLGRGDIGFQLSEECSSDGPKSGIETASRLVAGVSVGARATRTCQPSIVYGYDFSCSDIRQLDHMVEANPIGLR